jgi:XTP/dITP diphosphohydrolase
VTGAPRWVLASSNRGKAAELEALLKASGIGPIELVAQSELGIASPPEDASTFVENALAKARHAARASGLPALADDSGLLVAAREGAPGVRSARNAGAAADDAANVARLLAALAHVPAGPERAARFVCVVVALAHADDPAPVVAQGEWRGQIAVAPAGGGGFGYDPVFFDPRLGATAAEVDSATKNRASHRGAAMRALAAALAQQADAAVR